MSHHGSKVTAFSPTLTIKKGHRKPLISLQTQQQRQHNVYTRTQPACKLHSFLSASFKKQETFMGSWPPGMDPAVCNSPATFSSTFTIHLYIIQHAWKCCPPSLAHLQEALNIKKREEFQWAVRCRAIAAAPSVCMLRISPTHSLLVL